MTNYTHKIYKRRQDHKIQKTWFELGGEGRYRSHTMQMTEDGLKDIETSQVTSDWTQAEPKNIGKANETTEDLQALAEVSSKLQKMLESGYVRHVDEVDNPPVKIMAMLAKKYDEKRVGQRIEQDGLVLVQPKLDGVRCIAMAGGLFKRSGKRIMGMSHIEEQLAPLFKSKPELILDGELYNHEFKDNFNKIVGTVQRAKNIDLESAMQIEYHIYDVISDEPFAERFKYETADSASHIKIVNTESVYSVEEIVDAHKYWSDKGYEGLMVRYNTGYQINKRTWDLQKLKSWQDEEYEIKDILEGSGKNAGLASTVVIEVDGVDVRPTLMGTIDFRIDVFNEVEEYIGGTTTVEHFGKTPDGSLRFPKAKMVYKKNESKN